MERLSINFASCNTSKTSRYWVPTEGLSGASYLPQLKTQRQYNEPLEVRRRLTRIVTSYCDPLKWAMRNQGPKRLMKIIRDAMIVYYEAYKRPEHGFIHGDIFIENIMVLIKGTELTGGLTNKDRCGTIVDWNLCFTADGQSSNRSFRSGTPAFMAPALLRDKILTRRTLGHDMESFFAVIIWMTSFDYSNDDAFLDKPLAALLDDTKSTTDIVNAKLVWFRFDWEFKTQIIQHFQPLYQKHIRFVNCISNLREILYGSGRLRSEQRAAADPEEDLFRTCMKKIDDYFEKKKKEGL